MLAVSSALVVALIISEWRLSRPRFSAERSVSLIEFVHYPVEDAAAVRELLEQGADPNVRIDFTDKPRSFTWRRTLEMLFGESSQAPTVLMAAASENKRDIVRLLLEYGADPNIVDRRDVRKTALHYAVEAGAFHSIQALIAHRADVNVKDSRGNTPLFYAGGNADWGVLQNETHIVHLLLQNGAAVNVRNNAGATPLLHAAEGQHREAFEALLEAGARVDVRKNDGTTALHLAVKAYPANANPTPRQRNDQLLMIRRLLGNRANPSEKDKGGMTPLQAAENLHDKEVIVLLRNAAARAGR